jgi:predicted MFS family arabinose efflux permease
MIGATGRRPLSLGSNRYAVLVLLTAVYALNVLDRFILGILLPFIKKDLQLSDTGLGFLTGAAFAIFYATLGVPIARLADQTSRRAVIAASLACFSLMTTLSGFAQNFWHLLLARVGVGVGEAGTNPASYSIISDLFGPTERATAMAILTIGANVGLLLGFLAGGAIAANHGWRMAFLSVGMPGIVLALIVWLWLPEPKRNASNDQGTPSLGETLAHLWTQRAFVHLLIGSAVLLFVTNGIFAWLPSFLDRSHAMPADRVGLVLGLAFGIGGILGTLVLGGVVADRLGRRDCRWPAWLVSLGAAVLFPCYLLLFLTTEARIAMAALVIPAAMGFFFQGPTLAMTQGLAKPRMRATAGALLLLVGNLVGLGLGPLMVGILSDLLAPTTGADSLRQALLLLSPAALWAAFHFYQASKHLADGYKQAGQQIPSLGGETPESA